MFTAAVFEMIKRRKQPDCLSAESEYLEAHVRGGAGVVIESSPPWLLWRGAWERGAGTRPSPSVAWPPWIPRREEPRASSRAALSMNDRKYHRAHVSSVSRDPSHSLSSNPPPPAPSQPTVPCTLGIPCCAHPCLERPRRPPLADPAALSPQHKHLLVTAPAWCSPLPEERKCFSAKGATM